MWTCASTLYLSLGSPSAVRRRSPPLPKPHLGGEAGGAGSRSAIMRSELDTVLLCLRAEASPFWIILLLVSGDPAHPRFKLAAPRLPKSADHFPGSRNRLGASLSDSCGHYPSPSGPINSDTEEYLIR